MTPTAHNYLRTATAPAHRRLDSHPLLTQLLSKSLDLELYRQILAVFHGFYAVHEPLVEAGLTALALPLDLVSRRKWPLLVRDGAQLQIDLPPPEHKAVVVASRWDVLGLFYVLEGSTLGGQVIARHLRAQLGLDAQRGAAFFHSYGDQVGPRWQETLAILSSQSQLGEQPQEQNLASIATAANATFAALEAALTASQAPMPSVTDAPRQPRA